MIQGQGQKHNIDSNNIILIKLHLMRVFSVSGTHDLNKFFTTTLRGRYYYAHFTDGEIKAWRVHRVFCPTLQMSSSPSLVPLGGWTQEASLGSLTPGFQLGLAERRLQLQIWWEGGGERGQGVSAPSSLFLYPWLPQFLLS